MPAPKKVKPQLAQFQPLRWTATIEDGKRVWHHFPPPLEDITSGRCKWRLIWCAGYDLDADGVTKHYHHNECIPCHCPPGPQVRAALSSAKEIALWGGRNSAKSEVALYHLVKGNSHANPPSKPADHSYLNCPDYAALVIRKNAKDLRNYFERAKRFFAPLGGEPTQEPMGVRFPASGAYMIFDHMADGDAWEKYQGPEWTRMVIEEAPQLGSEEQYLRLIASCRTSNPDMTAQVMLTANPGGVGWQWFKARFIYPEGPGKRQPNGLIYTEPYSGRTRAHIKSTVDDNPLALVKGGDKDLDLYKETSPALYRQWRFGDPDAVAGQFFAQFREKPAPGEPENACHIVAPHQLDNWWPRAISCDWGYAHPSAVYWGCWHPKKQLHVYREFVLSKLGATELGAQIAERSLEDLKRMPNPHMNLYLSHDAFARTNDTASEAEQIAAGINKILGNDAAFVFDQSEEERLLADGWEAVKKRHEKRWKNTYITVINAGMARRANMNRIRDYLRWTPLGGKTMDFDETIARSLLEVEGALAYQEYKRKCEQKVEEVLPILQIHYDPKTGEGCRELIASILSAVEKENDPEQMEKQNGDDPVDSLAYLTGNFTFHTAEMPKDMLIQQKIAAIRQKTPGADLNGIIMSLRRVENQHTHRAAFNIPRPGGSLRRHRAMAGAR